MGNIVCTYDDCGFLSMEAGSEWVHIYKEGECRVRFGDRPLDIPPPVMMREIKPYRAVLEEVQRKLELERE